MASDQTHPSVLGCGNLPVGDTIGAAPDMIRVSAFLIALAMAVAIFAACGSSPGNNSGTVTVTPMSSAAPGTWTISGQLVGSMDLTVSACQIGPPGGKTWGAQLAGTLNGTVIGLAIASGVGGTVDLSSGTPIIAVHYGGAGTAINDYWSTIGSAAGASGSITINSDASGSMNVTLPPSLATVSGAAQQITISGRWVCP